MDRLWRGLRRSPAAAVSAGFLLLLGLAALGAPWLAPHDPLAVDLDAVKLPPGPGHPFGTDPLGRDLFSRVLYGARISLGIGVAAALLSTGIGLAVGLVAGFRGGRVDAALVALLDLVFAFPSLLMAIGISVVLPPSATTVVLALALVGWATFARLVRGQVLSLRQQPFVEAAQAIGATGWRILTRHLLPNCLPVTLVALSLRLGGFILAEAALSFLGLGAQPPTPTWGGMVSLYRIYLASAPWLVVFPGLAIALTVVAFNVLGDYLRDALDPTLRV